LNNKILTAFWGAHKLQGRGMYWHLLWEHQKSGQISPIGLVSHHPKRAVSG
jgi:hypothetical protein